MTCNIYEAKPDNVLKALPQVVMAAVVQSQRFGYPRFFSQGSVLIAFLGSGHSGVALQRVKNGSSLCTTRTPMVPVVTCLGCHQSAWNVTSAGCLWSLACYATGYVAWRLLQTFDLISNDRSRMGRNSRCGSVLTLVLLGRQAMIVRCLVSLLFARHHTFHQPYVSSLTPIFLCTYAKVSYNIWTAG